MSGAPLQVDDLFSTTETVEIVDQIDMDDGTPFRWADYVFRYLVGRDGCAALALSQGDAELTTDPANGLVVVSLPPGRLGPGEYLHELSATHTPTGKALTLFDGTLTITEALR